MIILSHSEDSLLCPDALVLNYVFQLFMFDSWHFFYGVRCICALTEPQYDTLASSFKKIDAFFNQKVNSLIGASCLCILSL